MGLQRVRHDWATSLSLSLILSSPDFIINLSSAAQSPWGLRDASAVLAAILFHSSNPARVGGRGHTLLQAFQELDLPVFQQRESMGIGPHALSPPAFGIPSSFLAQLQTFCFGLQASLVVARGLGCPAACGILFLQWGIEPMSPALEGRFLTNEPPRKSPGSTPCGSVLTATKVVLKCPSSLTRMGMRVWIPGSWGWGWLGQGHFVNIFKRHIAMICSFVRCGPMSTIPLPICPALC